MIVSNQHVVPVISNQSTSNIKLGVSRTGFSHLRDIVSNFIYSDKILAPIREYSTNAVDAHVEKGIANRPIVVRLPNTIIPTFAVRDFGYGLSREQIVNVFANYGESTKRGSNDAIGMLGIGSKSAFAYGVKSFMVISYQNGKKTTYVVSIEQSVDGDIVEFGSTDTNEEDGLEVQFGVKTADISSFLSKASSFFQHWSVMPIFEGNTLAIRPVEKLYQGNNWYLSNCDDGGCKLLMGNITYALNYNNIKGSEDYSSPLSSFFRAGFVLTAPIGSVDIAASRETLQYTERTQKYIHELAVNARNELVSQVVKTFDSLPTTFDKKCMLGEFQTMTSPYYKLAPIIGDVIKSKYGISYQCEEHETTHGFQLSLASKSRRGQRRVRTVRQHAYTIECSKNIAYVLDDGDVANYNRKLAPLIEKTDNYIKRSVYKVYSIKVTDKALFDAWCKSVEFDVPLIKLSELPSVKMSELYPTNSNRSSYVNTNTNNGRKVLELIVDDNRLHGNSCFKPWDSTQDTGEPIPFVTIERYMIKNRNDSVEPETFIADIKEFCKMFGINLPKIAAVRVTDVAKLDVDEYVPFSEYILELINDDDELLKRIGDVAVDNSVHSHTDNDNGYFNSVCRYLAASKKDIVSSDSVAIKYLSLFVTKRDMSFLSYLGGMSNLNCYTEVENRIKAVSKMSELFIKTYPMIKFVDVDLKYYQDKASSVVDYINFVDSCKNIKPVDKSVGVV